MVKTTEPALRMVPGSTPPNVQTVEGRKTTVFAVKLTLMENNRKLKPGMPADVTFEEH
jgi:hypothetical protein